MTTISWLAAVRLPVAIPPEKMLKMVVGVESPSIGDFNTFQPRSKASAGVIITDNCTLCLASRALFFP